MPSLADALVLNLFIFTNSKKIVVFLHLSATASVVKMQGHQSQPQAIKEIVIRWSVLQLVNWYWRWFQFGLFVSLSDISSAKNPKHHKK